MTFSIILPFFNSSKTIYKAIDSILSQTFRDFELVVINDGSQDDSEEILKKHFLRDTRISYYSNSNRGVSFARNFGISKAKGDYILFIDSDDFVDDIFLEQLSKDLLNNDNKFIVQGFKRINEKGILLSRKEFENETLNHKDILNQELLLYLTPFCKIFERKIIIDNNLLFNQSLTYAEDNIFTLEYIGVSKKEIFLSNECNYNYLLAPNSLSSRLLNPDDYYKPLEIMDNLLLSYFNLDVLKSTSGILADKYLSLLNMYVNSIFIKKFDEKEYLIKLSNRHREIYSYISRFASSYRKMIILLIKYKQYRLAKLITNIVLKKHFRV